MLTERELQISPIVQESVLHNTKVRPVPPSHHTTLVAPPSLRPSLGPVPNPSYTTATQERSAFGSIFSKHASAAVDLSLPHYMTGTYTNILPRSQTLTTLHNLTASLFGVGAGILGLESYLGVVFYLIFSLITSALVYAFRVRPVFIQDSQSPGRFSVGRYFRSSIELWTGGLFEGLSGFVLTWTLFYGLVRA